MAERYDEAKRWRETKDEFEINDVKITSGDRSIHFQIDFSGTEPERPFTADQKIAQIIGPVLEEKGFLDDNRHVRGHVRCLERVREIDNDKRQIVITYLKQTD